MLEEQDVYHRALIVNQKLRELGHSWEQIENFWKECFTISKESINS